MRIKRLFFITVMLIAITYINNISASSIDYTLKVDKNRHFYETVTYTIENDTTNEYLKYILNNKIFFDLDNKYMYKKTITNNGVNTVVTLKYDYDSVNIKKSKILNNCFKKFKYEEDEYRITYYGTKPFYCEKKADKITINVITDIEAILYTADEIVDNKYTWNKINENFAMDLSLGKFNPNDDVLPPVSDPSRAKPLDEAVLANSFPAVTRTSHKSTIIITGASVVIIMILLIIYARVRKSKEIKVDSFDSL